MSKHYKIKATFDKNFITIQDKKNKNTQNIYWSE